MAVSALNALTSADILNKNLIEHYGFSGEIKKLSGERDQNFYLLAKNHQEYVVKVSDLSSALEIKFQNDVLAWLNSANLPIPNVIHTKAGKSFEKIELGDGDTKLLRILSWLNGTPLGDIDCTDEIVRDIARTQSKINIQLSKFPQKYVKHDLVWDMEQISSLDHLINEQNLGDRFDLVSLVVSEFKTFIQPNLKLLRRQIIHNDFNPHNILVDAVNQKVTGVLDFGDVVEGPLIVDVAVAASYLIDINTSEPLRNVSLYLQEYSKVQQILDDELKILLGLVKTRLAMILIISSWRAAEHPDRKEYVMRNNHASWLRLNAISSVDVDVFNKSIKKLCAAY